MEGIKVKRKKKTGLVTIWYKLGKKDRLNQIEIDILRKKEIPNLEQIQLITSALGGTQLRFEVCGKTTLRD